MGVNKVEFGGETLIDLTEDTVTPETLAEGATATNAQGEKITGTMKGGISEAIVNVVELPTENINEAVFYRVLTAKWMYGVELTPWICRCVETLPEVGEVATTDMVNITTYYCASDGAIYGYADDTLGEYFGVPSGWYPVEALISVMDLDYAGVVTDIADCPDDSNCRVLLEHTMYTHKDGKWTIFKSIGSPGTGINAEAFNDTRNNAEGDYSHAEGSRTYANGYASHAEGADTASSGLASHAEGTSTAASGDSAHAEGDNSFASGYISHAEGQSTIASGDYQHVQGKFNIEDTENKYAHIVGNGDPSTGRANAHTLDWQGNAWFAGKIKLGGTGQDDPNAKELVAGVPSYTFSVTTYEETVLDLINYLVEQGMTFGTWFVVNIPDLGASLGLTVNHYHSYMYNIAGINLKTGIAINTTDDLWGQRTLQDLLDMFKEPEPAESVVGTRRVIDEPELPMTGVTIPFKFTSNGENFIGIDAAVTGVDSWGIRSLRYLKFGGDAVQAYTYNPSGNYGITHGWRDEAYKTLEITEETDVADASTWIVTNTNEVNTSASNGFEMPQIRFASATYWDMEKIVTSERPLKLTVEIVGGGALQVGDKLQICARRTYGYRDAMEQPYRKQKLRCQQEYVITEEDLDKRFLTITTDDSIDEWLFHNDRRQTSAYFDCSSAFYLRIKRVTKYAADKECDAIFSNVVTVWKTYNKETKEVNIK